MSETAPDRLQLRLTQLDAACSRLDEALAQPPSEFIRDSIIQRFEFAYELGWKALQAVLRQRDIDVLNARDALRAGVTQKLIADPDAWASVHRYRNLTVHTYQRTLAVEVEAFVRDTAAQLFRALSRALREAAAPNP